MELRGSDGLRNKDVLLASGGSLWWAFGNQLVRDHDGSAFPHIDGFRCCDGDTLLHNPTPDGGDLSLCENF